MANSDVRWRQRFSNFKAALLQLKAAVQEARSRNLSNLEKQGLIQAFEFTHELAWNVLKDYIDYQGYAQMSGSRDAVREAFKRGLVEEGDPWMEMIQSRNQTTHTYNQATADAIVAKIVGSYLDQFTRLESTMSKKLTDAD